MRTILTILHDNRATGVRTVEFSNRLIKGIAVPRSEFKKLKTLEIEELSFSGIYFLIGENENEKQSVYIGQAINIQKRFEQHLKDESKDFWNIAIAFTTNKEGNLTESEINYLEKALITRVWSIRRADLENKNSGNTCLIPPHKKADMEEYLSDMKVLLGSLGFLFLQEYQDRNLTSETIYYLTAKWCNAQGVLTEEGFLVFKGSLGVKDLTKSVKANHGYAYRKRAQLFEKNTIRDDGNTIVFEEDYLFSSPSGASSCLTGGSTNGQEVRKTKTGETFKQIQEGKQNKKEKNSD